MEQQIKQEILQLYKQLKEEDNQKENRLEKWRNLEPESAEFISIIIRTQQSKNVLELGTSNGFSTLWFADALNNSKGKLTSIEIEEHRTELARNYLTNFKLIDNVELLTMDAKDFLVQATPIYDIIFLDAERKHYVEYWIYLKKLLNKKGSLLIVDNVISHQNDVKEFVALIGNDKDYIVSTANIGAGILLVTKQ
ncbi:putative O-methyltransferase YrrM [Arcicella aurantiaca]|uniref:Putative O-methyltransferase YrrM n=1 Tax=Arcicella aurantiaca TaxID=591202 RepID=A0A316DGN7_9BACT|nr:class I SAM-dependent methyltransferase [Arcicella aurantiaca]PWK16778.1 putative O-methyltransferase YrrM [Arcicella aurantiaca]